MRKADKEDERYFQGVMDGVSLIESPSLREKARLSVADGIHVHYSSIIGPYCVICRIGIPPPYEAYWSEA